MSTHSLVVIGPDETWDDVRALSAAYSYIISQGIPFGPADQDPAPITHRVIHDAASETVVALLTGLASLYDVEGFTVAEQEALIATLTVSVDPETGERGRDHVDLVAASLGLKPVESAEPI